jgi:nitrogen regulatory protein PII
MKIANERIKYNLKLMKALKASGHTDAEIAEAIGVSLHDFLKVLSTDDYIREVYERAQDKLATEIEYELVERIREQLSEGKTGDAKWYLERVSGKFQKRDGLDVRVESIDEVIRRRGGVE